MRADWTQEPTLEGDPIAAIGAEWDRLTAMDALLPRDERARRALVRVVERFNRLPVMLDASLARSHELCLASGAAFHARDVVSSADLAGTPRPAVPIRFQPWDAAGFVRELSDQEPWRDVRGRTVVELNSLVTSGRVGPEAGRACTALARAATIAALRCVAMSNARSAVIRAAVDHARVELLATRFDESWRSVSLVGRRTPSELIADALEVERLVELAVVLDSGSLELSELPVATTIMREELRSCAANCLRACDQIAPAETLASHDVDLEAVGQDARLLLGAIKAIERADPSAASVAEACAACGDIIRAVAGQLWDLATESPASPVHELAARRLRMAVRNCLAAIAYIELRVV